ncbi:MAG: hypothetical protein ACRC1K_10175, partial [Planctomycetia bacterium]
MATFEESGRDGEATEPTFRASASVIRFTGDPSVDPSRVSGGGPVDVRSVHAYLAGLTADQRLLWGAAAFGPQMVQLSSMQKTASVLM